MNEPTIKSHGHSKNRSTNRFYSVSLILILIIIVGFFGYKLYQIEKEVDNLQNELYIVGSLARNANMHAHSHYSDSRLKQNLEDIDHPLDKVLMLNGVTFEWDRKIAPDRGFPEGRHIGFIAQELNEVFPELVSTNVDGYMFVDYAKFSPILVEAIKEQQYIIEDQGELIKLFQEQNESLDLRLRELEDLGE